MEPENEKEPENAHQWGGKRKGAYYELMYTDGQPNAKMWDDIAFLVAQAGYTDDQLATFLGVSRISIGNWKREHREFFSLINDNKKAANDAVVHTLFLRATGYDFIETKVFVDKGEIITTEVIKHIPPDVSAQRYWLNNRMPQEWKDTVIHVNQNTDVPQFDTSALSDEEIDIYERLQMKMEQKATGK